MLFQPLMQEIPNIGSCWLRTSSGGVIQLSQILPSSVKPSSLCCLRQPRPVCQLVCAKLWKELLLLASCCGDAAGGQNLTSGFPSSAFLAAMGPKVHVQAVVSAAHQNQKLADAPLQADMLDRIKSFLRMHIDLAGCSDEGKDEARIVISALTSWAKALREPLKAQMLSKQTRYSIKQLWHAFMTSRFVHGTGFRNALEHACGAHWPGLFASVAEQGPSPSTLRRSQLLVDMSLMLSARRRNSTTMEHAVGGQRRTVSSASAVLTFRWGWSDASPIGGREWLISKHVSISSHAVLPSFIAAALLGKDALALAPNNSAAPQPRSCVPLCGFALDEDGDDTGANETCLAPGTISGHGPKEPLTKSERQVLAKYLRSQVQLHCHIPTSLGYGATAAQHKAAALVHSVGMECSSSLDMQNWFNGIMAWTTDLGAESLLPRFCLGCCDMLPEWWSWHSDQPTHSGSSNDMCVCHLAVRLLRP